MKNRLLACALLCVTLPLCAASSGGRQTYSDWDGGLSSINTEWTTSAYRLASEESGPCMGLDFKTNVPVGVDMVIISWLGKGSGPLPKETELGALADIYIYESVIEGVGNLISGHSNTSCTRIIYGTPLLWYSVTTVTKTILIPPRDIYIFFRDVYESDTLVVHPLISQNLRGRWNTKVLQMPIDGTFPRGEFALMPFNYMVTIITEPAT